MHVNRFALLVVLGSLCASTGGAAQIAARARLTPTQIAALPRHGHLGGHIRRVRNPDADPQGRSDASRSVHDSAGGAREYAHRGARAAFRAHPRCCGCIADLGYGSYGTRYLTEPKAASPFDWPSGFRTQQAETNGATIHVRVGGKGPAVLLLHGYGEIGDMWIPLAENLARDHTVRTLRGSAKRRALTTQSCTRCPARCTPASRSCSVRPGRDRQSEVPR